MKTQLLEYSVVARTSKFGRTKIEIECPCCGAYVWAYVWSLAGCGKRCACGALHTYFGTVPAKTDPGPWGAGLGAWRNRKMAKYTAKMFGSSWARGPEKEFATITECREWAEEFGTTADRCTIRRTNNDQIVAMHVRSADGNGERWYKASV